jgi:hypothetical protein
MSNRIFAHIRYGTSSTDEMLYRVIGILAAWASIAGLKAARHFALPSFMAALMSRQRKGLLDLQPSYIEYL